MSDDIQFVRPPNITIPLTRTQVIEYSKCADPINGYRYFMENYFFIQHPTKGQIKYKPFSFQVKLIENYHNRRFSISMLSRQTGKTTSAAGYLLWFAMFNPDQTILIAAHQYSGAQEIMLRIRYAYEMCPMWLKAGAESYNQGNINFDNKSRIVARATTEKTGRGMSISLLYLDEFAFVRPTIAREFWTAISPTLSTGGKCIITSTPNSDEDQFSQLWKGANKRTDEFGNPTTLGVNGFSPFIAHWSEHPDRDEQWKEEEIGRIGEERFRREHELEFLIADETLIKSITLSELESKEPIERHGQVRWYKKPTRGKTYAIALDPSLGTGGDASAIQVLELPTMMQVAEWQHNKTPIQQQVRLLKDICQYIYDCIGSETNIYYSVENNTLGEAALVAISEVGEENIKGIFLTEPKSMGGPAKFRKGFTVTHRSKLAACSKLKNLIETKRLSISSSNLISELKTFISVANTYKARVGERDDLVMSMLLAVRMMLIIQTFDQDLDAKMRDGTDEVIMPMPFIMF